MDNLRDPLWKYSTSEISAFYDISNKGLEFYEKKGILSPERDTNGKYRVYQLQDCYNIYGTKMFRRCGFSVAETLKLVHCSDNRLYREEMLRKKAEIDSNIKIQARLSFHIQRIADLLQYLPDRVNQYMIVERPAMYRLYVRNSKMPHVNTSEESKEFAEWNNYVPLNSASLRFPMEQLLDGREKIDTGIGNVMLKEDFELMRFEESPRVKYLMPCRCVYTIICGDLNDLSNPEWLMPALEHLQKSHFTLCGDPISRYIDIFKTPEGLKRYDEVWLPI